MSRAASELPGGTPEHHLGGYELLHPIGRGIGSAIFMARRAGSEAGQTFAFKVLFDALAGKPELGPRLLEVGRLAGRLKHRNIAEVYDCGTSGAAFFVAMEQVAGWDLGAVRRRLLVLGRRLPIELALRIAAEACAGLGHAHDGAANTASGPILHGGLSPSNVMVSQQGIVKLLDFGTAALVGPPAARPDREPYWAPEQLRGEAPDARADLFGLGVTLFVLLTGWHPFQRGSVATTRQAMVNDEPRDPRTLRPDLPESLVTLMRRMLEPDRGRRIGSAAELAAALATELAQLLPPAAGSPPRPLGAADLVAFLSNLFTPEVDTSPRQVATRLGMPVPTFPTRPPAPAVAPATPSPDPAAAPAPAPTRPPDPAVAAPVAAPVRTPAPAAAPVAVATPAPAAAHPPAAVAVVATPAPVPARPPAAVAVGAVTPAPAPVRTPAPAAAPVAAPARAPVPAAAPVAVAAAAPAPVRAPVPAAAPVAVAAAAPAPVRAPVPAAAPAIEPVQAPMPERSLAPAAPVSPPPGLVTPPAPAATPAATGAPSPGPAPARAQGSVSFPAPVPGRAASTSLVGRTTLWAAASPAPPPATPATAAPSATATATARPPAALATAAPPPAAPPTAAPPPAAPPTAVATSQGPPGWPVTIPTPALSAAVMPTTSPVWPPPAAGASSLPAGWPAPASVPSPASAVWPAPAPTPPPAATPSAPVAWPAPAAQGAPAVWPSPVASPGGPPAARTPTPRAEPGDGQTTEGIPLRVLTRQLKRRPLALGVAIGAAALGVFGFVALRRGGDGPVPQASGPEAFRQPPRPAPVPPPEAPPVEPPVEAPPPVRHLSSLTGPRGVFEGKVLQNPAQGPQALRRLPALPHGDSPSKSRRQLAMFLRVTGNGRVTQADVNLVGADDDSLATCLESEATRLRFPRFPEKEVRFSFPVIPPPPGSRRR